MLKRLLTGLALLTGSLYCIIYGKTPLLILILVVGYILLAEILTMYQHKLYTPSSLASLIILGTTLLSLHQNPQLESALLIIAFFTATISLLELATQTLYLLRPPLLSTLKALALSLTSLPFFLLIRTLPNGLWLILFCCTTLWVCDTAALLIGKTFGKRKLSIISPNKTIEGSIGGTLFGTLSGVIVAYFGGLHIALFAAIACTLTLVGQMGDIHESLAKRHFKLKDSSQLLPGHGGIYDRCDSFIFALPLFYAILKLL